MQDLNVVFPLNKRMDEREHVINCNKVNSTFALTKGYKIGIKLI